MEIIDLKINLLSDDGIEVDNLEIRPYKLKEIREYRFSKYMKNIQWISLSVDDFINSIDDNERRAILESERKNLKTFDFFVKLGGTEVFESLIESLSMIFRTDDINHIKIGNQDIIALDFIKNDILKIDKDGSLVINDERLEEVDENDLKIIHRDNFDEIVEVIKLQNYLKKPEDFQEEKEFNPVNDEVAELKEQMKRMREKVEEAKRLQKANSKEDEIDISEIISAVGSKSHSINKLNIWNFTIYQLYDEYARLEIIDNYEFSIKAMMAGAEKINLKHWSSRI